MYKRHIDNAPGIFDRFERIRDTALKIDEALTSRAFDKVGAIFAEEWASRRELAPGITTPFIDRLIEVALASGAEAAKVCGAGGGGCLFCYGPPEARAAIAAALAAGGAQLLDYRIETEGLTIG
jgi:D-glycero-alpha-D-manno-heptose-7-phosphate kinase